MKHPFQIVAVNNAGDLLCTATKNHIQVFKISSGERIGQWTDEADNTESIKEKILKEQERQKILKQQELEEKAAKAAEEGTPESSEEPPKKKKKKSKNKNNDGEPKIPTPGPGAPTIYNYIRTLKFSRNGKYLIGTTDSDKSVVIFEIDLSNNENILKLIKRQPFPKRPSSITTSYDDSEILLGDKFGDVYSTKVDTQEARVVNSEAEPILGHVSMLTDVLIGKKNDEQFIFTADRDEHIKISKFPQSFIVKHWLFGHEQFVSKLLIPSWNEDLLISGGGDDYIFLWDWSKESNQLLDKFNISEIVEPYINESHLAPSRFQNENNDLQETCISDIITIPGLPNIIAVLVEATNVVFLLKLESNKISLDKIIELDSKIISITSSNNQIIASVESEDNLLRSIDINTKTVSNELSESFKKITENSFVEIPSKDELYPLYPVFQLRKRSEH
ncbi:putative WD repeat-containing protein [Wickerhamomyces ciferrii]|uniref:WD repeat-containing protein n=1 Tax=Wickerhamomyces ciferrii (strain ATCC 14091 / BCRC 22168 / CBS 111 / JCM 3599 / NBRC 0793 / NRRL Y-1031 F-60-10) TaxID=1206466 RepID=K0K9T8_WICCF|nr:putative WD repeat-containing protein [Wickerhamomyces ciferrii]CCH41695.1 putative WD repeat-containing protein [Wickerhamomyces ciferrii]